VAVSREAYVYIYAAALFLAFAASLAALYFYAVGDYAYMIFSALTAFAAYLTTRIVLFFLSRKE
jgi:membrane protein implicated in regulation of membrane protease activity